MQRIFQLSLRCRAAPFASGSSRWNPPALRRRDYPFNLAAPDLADKVIGGLCRVVKQMKFYGTTEGIDKSELKCIHDSEATATDRLPDGIVHDRKFAGTDDRVSEGKIWKESTHRDGAIYKKNWGFYGSGCPIDLADRRETDVESYKSSKVSPCYPYPGNCTRHPRDEMIQVCSMRLAKTPMNSDSIQVYGYLAARDFLDGRLNYIFNRSRDNPLTVQKGKLIEMTGPKRGIVIFADVLMEFDMRIKTGEKEEDDLQLIDGVASFNNHECIFKSYTLRFSGCHGGALDIRFAHIGCGMEAVIEVDAPEVNSAVSLSLISVLEEYGEIDLFHGDAAELGTKRFVVAVPDDTMMYLKFKVDEEGSEADLVHYCMFDPTRHGCVSRQIVLEKMVSILVKVSIFSPDPEPYP